MTAHLTGQGTHPSMHPGVLRTIESVMACGAPVLVKARSIFFSVSPIPRPWADDARRLIEIGLHSEGEIIA